MDCPGVEISGLSPKSYVGPSLENEVIVLAVGLVSSTLENNVAVWSVQLSMNSLSLNKIEITGISGFNPLKAIRNVKSVLDGSLSITPKQIAPAFVASVILLANVVSPRSTIAILPLTSTPT